MIGGNVELYRPQRDDEPSQMSRYVFRCKCSSFRRIDRQDKFTPRQNIIQVQPGNRTKIRTRIPTILKHLDVRILLSSKLTASQPRIVPLKSSILPRSSLARATQNNGDRSFTACFRVVLGKFGG